MAPVVLREDRNRMTALEGTLNDMSMVHLIQVLTISKKSGILVVMNDGVKGTLFVQSGKIVHAAIMLTLTNEVLLEGEEAFYTIMRWRTARFWFNQKAPSLPEYPSSMDTNNQHLIMEGLRRLDEEEKSGPPIGVDSWVALDPNGPPAAESGIAINQVAWHVLSLICQNVHRVGDLAEQSGLGKLLTLMTVAELADQGLLVVEPEPPAPPVELPDEEPQPRKMSLMMV